MPKKKITVVDIKDDENADIVDSNEVTTLETIIEENNIETQDKPIVEDTPVEEKQVEEKPVEEKPVEEKVVRTNELIKCPKCLKMVTSKTLRYSHKKTCTGEDKPTPISKPKPIKQVAKIEEEVPPSPPKLVRSISQVTPVKQQPTPEMMRTYRNEIRTQQLKIRSDRMSSLFSNSI